MLKFEPLSKFSLGFSCICQFLVVYLQCNNFKSLIMELYYNSVICLECGEKLISRHRHDFQQCSCSNETFVDGGLAYIRVGGKDLNKIQQFTINSEDKFEDIRYYFERGTYGKDGNQPLHYIKLKDMDDEHLDLLKDTHELYKKEIKYRKR